MTKDTSKSSSTQRDERSVEPGQVPPDSSTPATGMTPAEAEEAEQVRQAEAMGQGRPTHLNETSAQLGQDK